MWRKISTIFLFVFVLLTSPIMAIAQEKKVALVMKAAINPFSVKLREGAEAYALKNGISLDTFSLEFETDVDKQISIIKELITDEEHGAIILAPADSYRLVPIVKEALKKGVRIVNIDNKLNREQLRKYGIRVPFIGPDNFAAGEKVGKYVRFKLGGKGNVLIFEGLIDAENAISRRNGFIFGLGKKIRVLGFIPGNWHRDKAFNETISYFKTHKEKIDAILCANDEMALGVIQALSLLDKKNIIVTGYDNTREARVLLREKELYATVEQNPYLMGYLGVKYAKMLMDNKKVPFYTEIPTTLITYDTFGKKIGVLLSPSEKYQTFVKTLHRFGFILGEDIFVHEKGKEGLALQVKMLIKKGIHAIILLLKENENLPQNVIKTTKEAHIPSLILRYDGYPSKLMGIEALKILRDYFIGWPSLSYHFKNNIKIIK